jgi:hypothetical protein
MFVLLQTMALLQMAVLPGLVLTKLFHIEGALYKALSIFAMSLIFNFEFAFLFTSLHWYTRPVIFGLIAAELVAIAWLYRLEFSNQIPIESWSTIRSCSRRRKILLVSAAISFVTMSVLSLYRGPFPFAHSDAIFSWNRWALDWFANRLPTGTWNYPQLLPANWSLSYILSAEPRVQIFAHLLMPLFMIGIFSSIVDLGRQRSIFYWSVVSTAVALGLCMMKPRNFWFDTADVTVSFFSWLAIASLFKARWNKNIAYIFAGGIFAAGSALTKQSGLIIFVLFPFLAYHLAIKEFSLSSREKLRFILKSMLAPTALILPWWIYKQSQIVQGIESSLISIVTQEIYYGANYWERFVSANYALKDAVKGGFFFYPGIFLTIWSLWDRTYRWVTLSIVIPYYFVWAIFFSYDKRNLVFSMPATGVAIGVGAYHLYKQRAVKPAKVPTENDPTLLSCSPTWRALASMLAVIVLCLSPMFPVDQIFQYQLAYQKKLGIPELNEALYAYKNKVGMRGKILTSYQVLRLLPDLKEFYRAENFLDIKQVERVTSQSDVGYLLIYNSLPNEVKDFIQSKVLIGDFKQVFEEGSFRFLEKTAKLDSSGSNHRAN